MKLTKDKQQRIIDFLISIKDIRLLTRAPYIAEYDRENEIIKINTSVVNSTSDFLYALAHEVAHDVFDIDNESLCDELALKLANTDFFKSTVKNFFPRIYERFSSKKS
jgi:hypothetical protein